jgi:predicted branched-subunit amino acid permease
MQFLIMLGIIGVAALAGLSIYVLGMFVAFLINLTRKKNNKLEVIEGIGFVCVSVVLFLALYCIWSEAGRILEDYKQENAMQVDGEWSGNINTQWAEWSNVAIGN